MTYSRPEIHILGDASCVIKNFTKSQQNVIEFVEPASPWGLTPGYDLDE